MSYVIKTKLHKILVDQFDLETTAITVAFTPVKFGSTVEKVVPCDSNDADMIGWAHYPCAVGRRVDVILLGSVGIIPTFVASGQTATAGKFAVGVSGSAGYKNAPALSTGSTLSMIAGKFMSSGSSLEAVAMLLLNPIPVFTA